MKIQFPFINISCKSAMLLSIFAVLALNALSAKATSLPRLRVSDNKRFFVKADGTPFFYLGDTEWALFSARFSQPHVHSCHYGDRRCSHWLASARSTLRT